MKSALSLCSFSLVCMLSVNFSVAAGAVLGTPLVGSFSCSTNDKTELSMSDRTTGHQFHDLDGDSSDPTIFVDLIVTSEGSARLQSVFAGKVAGFDEFAVVNTYEKGRANGQLIGAIGTQTNFSWVPAVIHLTYNTHTKIYAVMTSTLSGNSPELGNGETFVTTDINLFRCLRK